MRAPLLAARRHYIDLGGLFHMTRRQPRLDREFRAHRLLAVSWAWERAGHHFNLMARLAAEGLPRVRSVRAHKLGGADLTRYASPLAFWLRAGHRVVDELMQPAMVFAGGRFRSAVAARDGRGPRGLPRGPSTRTPRSTRRSRRCRPSSPGAGCANAPFPAPRTIPSSSSALQLCRSASPAGCHAPAWRGVALARRPARRVCRLPRPPDFADDRDFPSVVVESATPTRKGARFTTVRADLTALPQRRPPSPSAVARDTGFPPAIVAGMILDWRHCARGVHAPETCSAGRMPFEARWPARPVQPRRDSRRTD